MYPPEPSPQWRSHWTIQVKCLPPCGEGGPLAVDEGILRKQNEIAKSLKLVYPCRLAEASPHQSRSARQLPQGEAFGLQRLSAPSDERGKSVYSSGKIV